MKKVYVILVLSKDVLHVAQEILVINAIIKETFIYLKIYVLKSITSNT